MSILFSASEVGSVRALLPICHELIRRGEKFLIDHHGFFTEIDDLAITPYFISIPDSEPEIERFLKEHDLHTLVFSVNIRDIRPLTISRAAQTVGMCTLHVLDYWNGYRSRLELDGRALFQATRYLVPDSFSREQAIAEDINKNSIMITGQPAFADTENAFEIANKNDSPFDDIELNKYSKIVLFASEPVSSDQGKSIEENNAFRGYVEEDAMRILLNAIMDTPENIGVCIVPHPRQDPNELSQLWSSLGGDDFGKICSELRGRDLLPFVDGVSGMASTLLYEAWLIGKPVISIQPNLRNDSLRMMQSKSGVVFIDQAETGVMQTKQWLSNLDKEQTTASHEELKRHKDAPALIADIALTCFNEA